MRTDPFWLHEERFWLVDPLDGTKEFIKQTGEFTVNIGLIEHSRPVLGVVHAPAIGVAYFADTANGAWRQDGSGKAVRIRTRAQNPSDLVVVASKDHAGPIVEGLRKRRPDLEFISMGSSLKFCLVAEGKADLYIRDMPTMEWDTAAAHCVLERAGGQLTTMDGAPLFYGKSDLRNPPLLALATPRIARELFLVAEQSR